MKNSFIILSIASIMLSGCASNHVKSQAEDVVSFFVATSKTEPLPGASVSIIGPKGIGALGVTDRNGEYRISRRELLNSKGYAIMFCSKSSFCGVFRMDDQELFRYREQFITLSPASLL